ncbi:uncharacterized protein LOC135625236 isoform X2 [Musa acuminata AAA Group]
MMRTAAAMVSSSPGREKLPAPGLARILTGSGSRSRGRHAGRSSPMFSSRSKSVGRSSEAAQAALTAAGQEGEPSSPKVTCIGQVRIRNKKPARPETPRPKDPKPPCQCFHKALLCSLFPARKKPKGGGGRSLWRRWVPLGGRSGGYQRREPDSPRAPPLEFIVIKTDEGDEEAEAEEHEEATRVFVPSAPPKNALLLMRCRSAPHNSATSLATSARCAVSSLPEHQLPPPPASARGDEAESGHTELRKKKKNKSNERWRDLAAAAAELSEVDEEEEEVEEEEEAATGSESQRPLVLTRSRSEPAWRRRRAA